MYIIYKKNNENKFWIGKILKKDFSYYFVELLNWFQWEFVLKEKCYQYSSKQKEVILRLKIF